MKKIALIIFASTISFFGLSVAQQPETQAADDDIRELIGLYSCSAYYKLLATQNKPDADFFANNAAEIKSSATALLAELQKNPYAEKQLDNIDVTTQGSETANQWLQEKIKQPSAVDQHLIVCQMLLDKYRLVYLLEN